MEPVFFLLALQVTPRAAVLPLTPEALSPQWRSRIEAGLALQGYSGVDAVDRAAVLGEGTVEQRDPRALYVEARKAFFDFDYDAARTFLDASTQYLLESPRFLPERSLLGDVHLLRAQIEQSEGRLREAQVELQRVALLEPERRLHPGLYPPDLVSAYTEVKKSLVARARAALEVRSRPLGAAVYVDAQPGGTAPLVADSLVAGPHYVTVSLPQRGSRTRSVELVAGRSTSVEIFVPDPAGREPARHALSELRGGHGDRASLRRVLDYLGADLLLLLGPGAAVELAFVDAQQQVQQRHFKLDPEQGVDAIVGQVLAELPREQARFLQRGTEPETQRLDAGAELNPWLWGGLGAAGLGALLAGGVGLTLWLAPRAPVEPEERVDVYLGGGASR